MNNNPFKINFKNTDLDDVRWIKHDTNNRKGAEIFTIYMNEDKTVALVKFLPGAFADAHLHKGFECIYVIDGEYEDETGKYKHGDLVVYSDQSIHSWSSTTGALLYVVWGGKTVLIDK